MSGSASPVLPPQFIRTITDVHGDAGAAWIDGLGGTLEQCALRWRLRLGEPFSLTYNYVTAATRGDGEPCVLKLGVPGTADLHREAAVMGAVDGEGAARLLDFAPDLGAMLLERVLPGDALWSLPAGDREATAAIASVLGRWWRAVPDGLDVRPLAGLTAGFDRYRQAHLEDGPLPASLVDKASTVFTDLLASTERPVLLHGDLHHGNVLRSDRGAWLAIDPKGLAGDAAYDCAAMLCNPHHLIPAEPDLSALLTTRATDLADALGLDRDRVLAWGFAHAVLSEVWSVEDHGGPHGASLLVAEALAPLVG